MVFKADFVMVHIPKGLQILWDRNVWSCIIYHCQTVRLHTETHGQAWARMGRYGQKGTDMDRHGQT